MEHEGTLATIEMGARQYVPGLGRFLQVDPVPGGCANDYAYVNDPINQYDLDGRKCPGALNSVVKFLSVRAAMQGLGALVDGNHTPMEALAIAMGAAPSTATNAAASSGRNVLRPIGRHALIRSWRVVAGRVAGLVASGTATPVTAGATVIDFLCNPARYQTRGNPPLAPGSSPTASTEYLRNQNA